MRAARFSANGAVLVDALEVLASAHARRGDPVLGLAAALEGAQLAQGEADVRGEARLLALAASAYLEVSEPADALVLLERAISCVEGSTTPGSRRRFCTRPGGR